MKKRMDARAIEEGAYRQVKSARAIELKCTKKGELLDFEEIQQLVADSSAVSMLEIPSRFWPDGETHLLQSPRHFSFDEKFYFAVYQGEQIEEAHAIGDLPGYASKLVLMLETYKINNLDLIIHPRTASKIYSTLERQMGPAKDVENWWSQMKPIEYYIRNRDMYQKGIDIKRQQELELDSDKDD